MNGKDSTKDAANGNKEVAAKGVEKVKRAKRQVGAKGGGRAEAKGEEVTTTAGAARTKTATKTGVTKTAGVKKAGATKTVTAKETGVTKTEVAEQPAAAQTETATTKVSAAAPEARAKKEAGGEVANAVAAQAEKAGAGESGGVRPEEELEDKFKGRTYDEIMHDKELTTEEKWVYDAMVRKGVKTRTGKSGGGRVVKKKKANDKKKEIPEDRRRFEPLKKKVFELEKTNNDKLLVFLSKGGWYKMGGNSALIYYHRLAKRMSLKPRLNPDTDFFSRFSEGVISIRDINTLENNLKTIKIYKNVGLSEGNRLIVFDLGYKVSDADLEAMRKDEETRRGKVNRMVLPKMAYPDAYAEILNVIRLCYPFCRRMPVADRELIGNDLIEQLRRLHSAFMRMSNGYIDEVQGLKMVLGAEENVKSSIKIMMELKMCPVEKTLMISESLVKLEQVVRTALKLYKPVKVGGVKV